MKKIILSFVLGLSVPLFFAFDGGYMVKPNTTEVQQESGIYVFTKCVPVLPFDYLGTVKMPTVLLNGRPKEMYYQAIKRAKEQFANCNGIILKGDQLEKVEAIFIK